MEKKKLLLVAVSVGVFLVVVIGAAVIAFSPGNRGRTVESRFVPVREPVYPGVAASGDGTGQEQPASIDAVDIIRNPNGIEGLQPLPVNSGIQQENNFYINNNSGQTNRPVLVERTGPDGSRVLINVPRPSTAAVPDTSFSGPAPQVPAAKGPAPAPAPAPAKKTTVAASPAKVSPAAPRPASPPRPAAQAPVRTYDTYWIQTGSFAVKARAEGAKKTLASRGITSIIENRDINGKTFFRVRIGPYTSKNEADYWLSLVKAIDGFEDSLVWQNKSRR